jgi:D-glycerate 3-kinase
MPEAVTIDPALLRTLCDWIAQVRCGVTAPAVIGINGAQGSGKSTLARALALRLCEAHSLQVATLSIDDFYLTRDQRLELAAQVHPLLRTRGVPGTHDVTGIIDTIARLKALRAGETLALPRFVKALDDRAPPEHWPLISGPIDLILFEGWCVGTPSQDPAQLDLAVNALERDEDAGGVWRRWVNQQLAGAYAGLFASLDRLIFLQAPDFDCVPQWRRQQEADNVRDPAACVDSKAAMTAADLARFIAHYERLSRHALAVLPAQADVVIELDRQRTPRQVRMNNLLRVHN